MGNAQSTPAINARIDLQIPHDHDWAAYRGPLHAGSPIQVFPGGWKDRHSFVESIRIILSQNGALDLGDKKFRLLYTRLPDERPSQGSSSQAIEGKDRILASMVAVAPGGTIVAKLVSEVAGADQIEAFKLLRKHVEVEMHKLLDGVPTATGSQSRQRGRDLPVGGGGVVDAPASPVMRPEYTGSATTLASTIIPDDPPTYTEANK